MTEKPEELNNRAIILANDGNYNDAISCFKRALQIETDNSLLWYNLGVTYRDMGDLANSRNSFIKALKLSPENEEIIEALATCCIQMRRLSEAEHYSTCGLSCNEMNSHFWNLLGVINFQKEQYEEASDYFEQAVYINPYFEEALINLRDTYDELKNKNGVAECQKKLDELK